MKMLFVLALACLASAEPEADPQTLLYNVPVVQKPAVVYNAAHTVVKQVTNPVVAYSSPIVRALTPVAQVPSHVYTSYNSPNQYTMVKNVPGAFGPNYVAKSAPGVVHQVKREAEADPQSVFYTSPVVSGVASTVAHSPVTYTGVPAVTYSGVQSPAVTYTGVHNPAVTYTGIPAVTYNSIPAVAQVPSHVYTSYNSPNQYTMVKNVPGAIGPNYVAKSAPGVVHEVQKREAEADPQSVFYTSPVVSGVASTVAHSPVTYTGVPAVTYSNVPAVTYNNVPAVTYNHVPAVTYNAVPAASAVTYSHVPTSVVYKGVDHGVSVNYLNQMRHSSHDNICLNNIGQRVVC